MQGQIGLTDIHTHILPGIDDGAKDLEKSLAILQAEIEAGVTQIVFTPHFYIHKQKYESFLERRQKAFEQIKPICEQFPQLKVKLGAEVHYSPQISEMDLKPLCIQDTPFLLLELSSSTKPIFFEESLFQIQSQGVIPVLAHIERYPYIAKEPTMLAEWLDAGVLTQINATSLLEKSEYQKAAQKYIQWGMVHMMASDTHSIDKRPPNLAEGLEKCDESLREQLILHGEDIFAGNEFAAPEFTVPRKRFGRWV